MIHAQMTGDGPQWLGLAVGFSGVALGLADGRIKKMLRERYTLPRIGYLSERGGEPLSLRRRVVITVVLTALALMPVALIAFLVQRPEPTHVTLGWMRWFPGVAGAFMVAAAFIDYRRFKLPRLMVSGVLTMIAGVASSLINAAFLPLVVFCLLKGTIEIVSGTSALVALVRSTPINTE
jgi:hypothetical protein